MPRLIAIDRAHKLLASLGWSSGDMSSRMPNGSLTWQVTCSREGHTIMALGETQRQAWNVALNQAGELHRQVL